MIFHLLHRKLQSHKSSMYQRESVDFTSFSPGNAASDSRRLFWKRRPLFGAMLKRGSPLERGRERTAWKGWKRLLSVAFLVIGYQRAGKSDSFPAWVGWEYFNRKQRATGTSARARLGYAHSGSRFSLYDGADIFLFIGVAFLPSFSPTGEQRRWSHYNHGIVDIISRSLVTWWD